MENARPDLIKRLEHGLPEATLGALRACETVCSERNAALYLVGGAVRDLMLERETVDLDLALESDVGPLAEALAAKTGGRAVFHPRFGTASVTGASFRLDLARTRRETYAKPGALPVVASASLLDDLARRDFTVNAMALRLTSPAELIDPFHGEADVKDRLIRVLHAASFKDDATRMLRAARYAGRLGLKIGRLTEGFLRNDLLYVDAVSGPRLRRELSLMFEQPGAVDAALIAQRLGVFAAIHSALRLDEAVVSRWRDAIADTHYASLDELGYGILADVSDDATLASLSKRLHLTGRVERALSDLVRLRGLSTKLAGLRADPVATVETLEGFTPAAVWALAVREGGDVAETSNTYLREWRRVKPHLRGDDLIALGVTQGVAVGDALKALRNARLQGRVKTREDEVELVRAMSKGR